MVMNMFGMSEIAGIRKLYQHLRTVVLVKSNDLLELAVFEFETVIYPTDQFWWQWNENNNLEGFNTDTDNHIFTWQPHGSNLPSLKKSLLID